MNDKDYILLEKILKYIEELKIFIKGYDKAMFYMDRKTINACVFDLSQIGEIASKLSNSIINENPRNRMERIKSVKK